MRRLLLILLAGVAMAGLARSGEPDPAFGVFPELLQVESMPQGGGNFRLLRDFEFRDPTGARGAAPKGMETNGASIPWWVLGLRPWSGDYKEAAVIHDHFTVTRSRPSKTVHFAFYQGMRANGVERELAGLMYAAVLFFGPHWTDHRQRYLVCKESYTKDPEVTLGRVAALCGAQAVPGRGRIYWPADQRDEAAWRRLKAGLRGDESPAAIRDAVAAMLARSHRLGPVADELGLLR